MPLADARPTESTPQTTPELTALPHDDLVPARDDDRDDTHICRGND